MRYATISGIGTFTALDPSATDWLRIDPNRCTGGTDQPLRTTVEPAAGQDGAIVLPALNDAQIITLGGDLMIGSATDGGTAWYAALDTLLASLKTALDALKAAPGNLVSNDGTVSVWKYAPIDTSYQGALMGVTFSVVVDVFA